MTEFTLRKNNNIVRYSLLVLSGWLGYIMAILEVCVDSIESAILAEKGGAKRIELCSALSEGGLTPSPGFLKVLKEDVKINIPIFCMLRPRCGNDFNYTNYEIKQILYDLEILKNTGADGFVFGALNDKQEINIEQCQLIVESCKNLPVTFHRAFDLTKSTNIIENCNLIESLGFKRILTSGLKESAQLGLKNLKEIATSYNGNVIIMPGAGINTDNLSNILAETGFKEFHASARKKKHSNKNQISMGNVDSEGAFVTDDNLVRKLVNIGKIFAM